MVRIRLERSEHSPGWKTYWRVAGGLPHKPGVQPQGARCPSLIPALGGWGGRGSQVSLFLKPVYKWVPGFQAGQRYIARPCPEKPNHKTNKWKQYQGIMEDLLLGTPEWITWIWGDFWAHNYILHRDYQGEISSARGGPRKKELSRNMPDLALF